MESLLLTVPENHHSQHDTSRSHESESMHSSIFEPAQLFATLPGHACVEGYGCVIALLPRESLSKVLTIYHTAIFDAAECQLFRNLQYCGIYHHQDPHFD